MTGWTDGGNSVFRSNPRDLSQKVTNVVIDKYNETWGMSGATSIAYFAKLDLNTGNHELGQFLLSRMDNNSGNSVGIKSLFVDNNENIYLGGSAYYKMGDNRDTKKINNQLVGAYGGGDAYIYKVNSTMNQRLMWHTWTATSTVSSGNEVNGIYERDGLFTFAGTAKGGDILTAQAIQSSKGGLKEAFFGVWGDVNPSVASSSSSLVSSSTVISSISSTNNSSISSSISNSIVSSSLASSSTISSIISSTSSATSATNSSINSSSQAVVDLDSTPSFLVETGNIELTPSKTQTKVFGDQDLTFKVQNLPLPEGSKCYFQARPYPNAKNPNPTFVNTILSNFEVNYTNNSCQTTLTKDKQTQPKWELRAVIITPDGQKYQSRVDIAMMYGAIATISAGAVAIP